MTLWNMQRDMTWLAEATSITEPTATTFANLFSSATVGTDGVGYTKHGHFQFSDASLGAGDFICVGVAIAMPEEDNIPFRFKGRCDQSDTVWAVGFTDTLAASATVEDARLFGHGKTIDDLVCLRQPSGTPNDYAVFFAATGGGASNFMAFGSAQRLVGPPDTFSAIVT